MQRTSGIVAMLAAAMLSGCVSIDGSDDGVITHTDHTVTTSERAVVMAKLQSALKAPGLRLRGLQASEHLETGTVTICGYVSGISSAGSRSPEAVFGGQIIRSGGEFVLFGGGGQGQDSNRAAQVRAICAAAGIHI